MFGILAVISIYQLYWATDEFISRTNNIMSNANSRISLLHTKYIVIMNVKCHINKCMLQIYYSYFVLTLWTLRILIK